MVHQVVAVEVSLSLNVKNLHKAAKIPKCGSMSNPRTTILPIQQVQAIALAASPYCTNATSDMQMLLFSHRHVFNSEAIAPCCYCWWSKRCLLSCSSFDVDVSECQAMAKRGTSVFQRSSYNSLFYVNVNVWLSDLYSFCQMLIIPSLTKIVW